MKEDLTQEEIVMFDNLSQSKDGQTLKKFLERLVTKLVDSRRIKDNIEAEIKGRSLAAETLEVNCISRLKTSQGIETENEDYS
jgi:hypothetical protein